MRKRRQVPKGFAGTNEVNPGLAPKSVTAPPRRTFMRASAITTTLTGLLAISGTNTSSAHAVPGGVEQAPAKPVPGSSDLNVPLSASLTSRNVHKPSAVDWISTFQANHGFMVSNATLADDQEHVALGTQSVRLKATSPLTSAQITRNNLQINTTNKHIIAWLRFENFGDQLNATYLENNRVGAIELLLGTPGFASYHTLRTWISGESIVPALNGEWFPIRFDWAGYSTHTAGSPPRDGLTDLRLRFITSSNVSPTNTLEVNIGGIGLVDTAASLYPNGVVSFTFDDAYADAFTEGKRILDRYGFAGTAYVIAEVLGTPGRLTFNHARAMQDISGWEIGGHSQKLQTHDSSLAGLDLSTLDLELAAHKAWLRLNGFQGDSFAYPRGIFNLNVIDVVRRYFSSGRTTSSQPLHNHPERLDPYLLTHCDASVANLASSIKVRLDEAKANKTWLILTHHRISPLIGLPPSELEQIVEHAASIGIAVRTVQDVVAPT